LFLNKRCNFSKIVVLPAPILPSIEMILTIVILKLVVVV